jgi:hypothetical protein
MDRTGKILLAVIALGIWANAAISISQLKKAEAQRIELRGIDNHLVEIEHGELGVIEDALMGIAEELRNK